MRVLSNSHYRLQLIFLFIICLLSTFLSVNVGSFSFSFGEIIAIFSGKPHPNADILLQIRLPRICMTLISGALLALSGLLMQTLVKNPLADPYIMGLTSGAGLGVNMLICGLIPIVHFSIFTLPLAACLGAIASLLCVFLLGYQKSKQGNDNFLLAGVATSSLCMALTGFVIYKFAQNDQVRKMMFWTLGSFETANWISVTISFALLFVLFIFSYFSANRLDILQLGDIQAQSLGMNVVRQKLILLLIISICIGGLIAFTGPIGFVGMMIPHIARALWGSLHRKLLLPLILLGASYLCLCDALSRLVLPPAGMPIGIITALLGVPFFMYLLRKNNFFF